MKHRTRCFGAAVLAALVLAMLCVPALAAEIAVDYTSEYQFSAADFSDSSELEGVYISAVPPAYQAELCIGSRVLRRGDILPAAALEKLKLRPVCLGEADCELVYCPISAGTLGDAVTVSLRILSGTNTAPVCEDGTLETYKNIANSGTLCAQDKEDTKLTYQLVKEPKRGTVELHDDGSFTYTPGKNKVGKDSFVFTATDPAGNISNEACVKIRILKPADKATYQDMSGDKDAFAAMWLKDQGLYTGRIIAGNLCFEPDDAVSRGEFLIACMKLAGLEQADGAISTGFADELETPAWQQPYLAAAYQSGMISGTPTEEGLVFRPEDTLSRAEAAVMLQKLLRLPGDAAVFAGEDASAVPAWAQSAVSALSEAGIPLAASDYEAPLTRRSSKRPGCIGPNKNNGPAAACGRSGFSGFGAADGHDLFDHDVQQTALVGVRRFVEDFLADAAGDDESVILEAAQMVADRGARHLHEGGDILHALLAVTQQPEDPHARGVAHLLEDIRDDLKIVRLCELRPDLVDIMVLFLAVMMRQQVRMHTPASIRFLYHT